MNMMRPTMVFAFGQRLIFPVTRRPTAYVVLGMKFPEEDITALRFIASGYYEGVDGVSYPCTATPSPLACISAPTNRNFHLLFLSAFKIPTSLIEFTPMGVISQYYPNLIKLGEDSFDLQELPQRIHATEEFTKEEIEGAYGETGDGEDGDSSEEGGYMYNCPWGQFYVDRPDLKGRDVWVDINVVFPNF